MTRYFRRHWVEDPGFELTGWGESDWLFATDEKGEVVEQIELFSNGHALLYDESHIEDEYGGLSEKPLDLAEFSQFEISADEFVRVKQAVTPWNR